jgi:broad-specificity NMP kinase
MIEMANHNTIQVKVETPRIVELVGLAGVGKTTLSHMLRQRSERIRVAADLALRNRRHVPIFAGYFPFLLPRMIRGRASSRGFTWDEMKAMVYLKMWPRLLRTEAAQNNEVILLDHGPIFKLATLNAFGPERLKREGFESWWHSALAQCASTLDMVVLLQAPNEILIERINARHQRHAVKGKSALDAHEFLMRYQDSFDEILLRLKMLGGPTPLVFDSSQASVEQIVDALWAYL